uniref:Uncharacterized protein n=1 Tax=Arundo donax TaxID=35708 RepID=A0A0A9CVE3_ARUDO
MRTLQLLELDFWWPWRDLFRLQPLEHDLGAVVPPAARLHWSWGWIWSKQWCVWRREQWGWIYEVSAEDWAKRFSVDPWWAACGGGGFLGEEDVDGGGQDCKMSEV